jgi:hypothetical protein
MTFRATRSQLGPFRALRSCWRITALDTAASPIVQEVERAQWNRSTLHAKRATVVTATLSWRQRRDSGTYVYQRVTLIPLIPTDPEGEILSLAMQQARP